MTAGDGSDGVDHGEQGQAKRKGNACKADFATGENGAADASKDKDKCSNQFCQILFHEQSPWPDDQKICISASYCSATSRVAK